MAMKIISVTDLEGFKLGNAENSEKGTGCTVIVCEKGAVGGVDVRGGGPATRETDLLRSENTVNAVNAVVLSGGSAFGLEAASGVMRELAEMKIGFDVGDDIVVPIVCGASLYDLPVGDPKAFPDVYMGGQAVRNAYEGYFSNGNHGAGTGATVGKLKGYDRAMKAGLGTFACGDGVVEVGAIAAVNAVGDVYNGAGNIIAGLRSEDGGSIYGTIKTLKGMVHDRARIVDDNTSFINRKELDRALSAAAKKRENESVYSVKGLDEALAAAAKQYEEEAATEEKVTEDVVPEEMIAEEPVAEEEIPEEPVTEETTEEVISEEAADVNDLQYAEVPIPVAAAETEEPIAVEVSEEVIAEEPVTGDVAPEETNDDEPIKEQLPEGSEADDAEEQIEEVIPEEAVAESIAEELPEEASKEQFPEESAHEQTEEAVEETAEEQFEEEIEEPVVLTREEMGYDIVFNTTISCLITNAALTKSQANKLASILHDAYARAIKPVHGTLDGDTVFVLATGEQQVNFDAFAALATDVMQYAIIDGAMSAEGAYGLPAAKDMQ